MADPRRSEEIAQYKSEEKPVFPRRLGEEEAGPLKAKLSERQGMSGDRILFRPAEDGRIEKSGGIHPERE